VSPALVGVVPSIEMVIWVAVGGRGSLWGAVAGTLLVNFAKDEISSALPDAWLYVLGLVFILVVMLMPRGVAGVIEDALPRLRPASPGRKVAAITSPAGGAP
jgi:urea transport system permease protein